MFSCRGFPESSAIMNSVCSSEDATRDMRGQPKRLRRNPLRRNSDITILCTLISSQSRGVFCALSRLFVRPGFLLFCSRLTVHFSAVHSVVTVCAARDIRLLFKLLLKFRTVLNIAMAEEPLLGIKVSTKTIPTVLRFSFTLKRNET